MSRVTRGRKVRSGRQRSPGLATDRLPTNRSDVASLHGGAGNRAVHGLLADAGGEGRPLDAPLQSDMEKAFAAQLDSVRVHRGPHAARAADALDAVAFTEGDEIYLGRDAPSADTAAGRQLLSHELAHVLQQRRAPVREGVVGRASDAFEQAADAAADGAAQGRAPRAAVSGPVPAVQTQPKGRGMAEPDLPFRAEVERAITRFLKRALKEQGERTLQITPAVTHAMMTLANADDPRKGKPDPGKPRRITAVQELLGGSMRPSDPAALAKKIAAVLPNPFDRKALDQLETLPASVAPPKGGKGVAEMVRRKLPAPFNPPQQQSTGSPQEVSDKNRKMEASIIDEHTFPVFHSMGIDVAQGASDAMKGKFERTGPRPAPEEEEEPAPPPAAKPAPAPARPAPAGETGTIALPAPLFEFSTALPTILEDFAPGSASLTPFHETQLANMVQMLLSSPNPDLATEIEIVGHSDASTEPRTRGVSLQRAAAVKKYLLGPLKVSELKIKAVRGAGELQPRAQGRPTAAAQARNRSVEVIVRTRAVPRPKPPFSR